MKQKSSFLLTLVLLAFCFTASLTVSEAATYSVGNPRVAESNTEWDTIWFGSYYQNDNIQNKSYLKWRVLNVTGSTALLISDKVIDIEEYNHKALSSCSWLSSTIRTYMNDTMKPKMFTTEETAALQSELELPSASMMKDSQYGLVNGLSAGKTAYVEKYLNFTKSAYWLSDTSGYKAGVVYNGVVRTGYYNNDNCYGIRPIVKLNLSADVWKRAGTVSSNGDVNEIEWGADDKKEEPASTDTSTTTSSTTSAKKATKFTAKNKSFKASTKTKKYTVTLKSGTTPIMGVNLTLKVNKKTYKATTNKKGQATFKIKNLKKTGKYNATVKFAGNQNYKSSTKKVKITVKK